MTDAFLEYLHRPRGLAARLIDADESVQQMWAVCTKMSTSFGQVGGGSSGGGDAKDGPLAAYAQLASDIEERRRELEETENEMRDFLHRAKESDREHGTRDELILRKRYVERQEWNAVMSALLAAGYRCTCLRTVFNWHRSAVERTRMIWEATHEPSGED